MANQELKKVETFWNNNLCGHHFIKAPFPSREFFEQYRRFRYSKEHHLDYIIDWEFSREKQLLEIGLGVGADSTRWASVACSYTGLDLTTEAVEATRIHLNILELPGKVVKGNAEELPFVGNYFDVVYSHGVLHHTPSIEAALREVYRVMKTRGKLIIMLYTKNSFNYWARIQFYFRLRFLFELFKDKLGIRLVGNWKKHVENFGTLGWNYFSWSNWPHRCTDGPDCEIANIYSRRRIRTLLEDAGFVIEKSTKAHFPIGLPWKKLEFFLAQIFGFYEFVWATKPAGNGTEDSPRIHVKQPKTTTQSEVD